MHDNSVLIRARIRRFVSERVTPAIYRASAPLSVSAWEVPDEPVPFIEARRQAFTPFAVGRRWGKPWGTTWFHVTGRVPEDWSRWGGLDTRTEIIVDLGFLSGQPGFQAEGLVFDPAGNILKAIEPLNNYVPLPLGAGGVLDVYVEAASNPDVGSNWKFRPTPVGDKATAGTTPIYRLRRMDVALLDTEVWQLDRDIWTLFGLMEELGGDLPRTAEILRALEKVTDRMDPDDVSGTAGLGRAILAPVLAQPAYASAHRIVAVGHAHIDSAWLWPVRETIRKCARTFANVLQLMDENPEFIFACSSAQQYAWMKEHYPRLFERIRERVIEGRFVPVGGMWVESDTNMPGGEALARQLIAGKSFFMREFGIEPLEVWLPDSFGYTAAFPQVVVAAGSKYFLTQKISWNETNTMPHHTFHWEGIDGTRVFTHFPPVDTYNSVLSGQDLARAQRQYAEKGASNVSLVPFGFGDGGGGPTREMLAAAERTKSLEGSPTVRMATPRAFFEEAEASYANPPVWSGELYLEFHRGTYTSQANTKAGNRRSEHLLREAELWATTAAVRTGATYPYDRLEAAWQTVLLNQFHDILPGSSIAWVHQVAEAAYAAVRLELEDLISRALAALSGPDAASQDAAAPDTAAAGIAVPVSFNASPFPVSGVPALSAGPRGASADVRVEARDGGFVLENGAIRVVIDARGLLVSLVELSTGREALPEGRPGNLLQLFRDTPTQWDAWDIDDHYQRNGVELLEAESVELVSQELVSQEPVSPEPVSPHAGRATVRVRRRFGSSTVSQELTLAGDQTALDIVTTVDWHERQKFLKLAFPLDVHADRAASEIQFGHIYRPTHENTSWDAARFETCAHRWVFVGEPGFGVAVANDSTYGHDISRTGNGGGGTTTTVRESLLRAPTFPDPAADQGVHVSRTSISLTPDVLGAAEQGYRINLPLRDVTGVSVEPVVVSDCAAIVVEAVKLAEDRSGDVIVRLYEARGGRAAGAVGFGFPVARIIETDLLERPVAPVAVKAATSNGVRVAFRAFQIVTLRVSRPGD
ncbi:alpha-mannosidase [Cryobacterium tagatosivorans]|uniref:Alpha-mannosidase n=1 Tax=Cryobacterium tagatosivorans TaxID=1259199 RepID=A0A4R8UHH8_9MICO|nr:glycoside hydrolase family 38 C-terminal domain-containing protein [Cryobacterium tagatosivorans]TFB52844.1 alpha-mannosidase [Cryobacterium tagatosivorans]